MNLNYDNPLGRNLPAEFSKNSASFAIRQNMQDGRKKREYNRDSYFQGNLLYMPRGDYVYVGTYPLCRYDASFNQNFRQVEHVVPQGSLDGTAYDELNDSVLAITMYTEDHRRTLSYGGVFPGYRESVANILNGANPVNGTPGFDFYMQNVQNALLSNYAKALAFVFIGYFEQSLFFRYTLLITGGLIFSSNRSDNELVQINLEELNILFNTVEQLFNMSIERRPNHQGEQDGYNEMLEKISLVLPNQDPVTIAEEFEARVRAAFVAIRNSIAGGQYPQFPW